MAFILSDDQNSEYEWEPRPNRVVVEACSFVLAAKDEWLAAGSGRGVPESIWEDVEGRRIRYRPQVGRRLDDSRERALVFAEAVLRYLEFACLERTRDLVEKPLCKKGT